MFLVLALTAAPFSYDGDLRAGQTLTIRDINGNVHVRAGEKLTVRASRTARTGDPNAVAIHVEQRPGGLVVCVRYPPDAQASCEAHHVNVGAHNDTTVDFDVTVPRGVAVDAGTVNGTVDATTDGPVDVTSVNGDVRAEGRAVHRAETVNGSVHVRVLDWPTGSLVAKTVNGSIDLSLPPGSGLALDAHTMNGDITAPGMAVDRPRYGPGARVHATSGRGAVAVVLDTINGSIAIR
ncbi:MAG TPA: hypothetical protein VGN14_11975 [Candidatus Elarobacter sp.]|jgi:hypothetical protein